jgi:hypothetical protein
MRRGDTSNTATTRLAVTGLWLSTTKQTSRSYSLFNTLLAGTRPPLDIARLAAKLLE